MPRARRSVSALLLLLAIGAFTLLLVACRPQGAAEALPEGVVERLEVIVSIQPQRYFVERVGGERVAVTVMVPPGASYHTYEPRPDQMRAVSRADVYFRVGGTFEDAWIARMRDANPNMAIVDTAEGIQRLTMEAHAHEYKDADDHAKEDEAKQEDEHKEKDEQVPDPHVWLSPRLVMVQARAIYDALAELDPEHEAEYRANLDAFLADLEELDAEITAALANVASRKFIVFHPAWAYFAADYGLEQLPIEVGGLEPSAADLAQIITTAREENIRVVLAQPEFSTVAAETIAREIGGRVELVSPLEPNWTENMRSVARTFAEVLGE